MSKYTTEVRFICETASGLTESAGLNDVESLGVKFSVTFLFLMKSTGQNFVRKF